MLRRDKKRVQVSCDGDEEDYHGYFTYRPLSNLPTPPPSLNSSAMQSPQNPLEDGEGVKPKFLGKFFSTSCAVCFLAYMSSLGQTQPALGLKCLPDTCICRYSGGADALFTLYYPRHSRQLG